MADEAWISENELASVVQEHGVRLNIALRDIPSDMYRVLVLERALGAGGSGTLYHPDAIVKCFEDGKLHYTDLSSKQKAVTDFKSKYFPNAVS